MIVARREFTGGVKHSINGSYSHTEWEELTSDCKRPNDSYESTGQERIYYAQAVLKFIASLPHGAVISVDHKPKKGEASVTYYKDFPVLGADVTLADLYVPGGPSPEVQAQARFSA